MKQIKIKIKIKKYKASGIILLGVGDSLAAIVGSKYGRIYWPGTHKTIEGSLAAVLGSIFVFYLLFDVTSVDTLVMLSYLSSFFLFYCSFFFFFSFFFLISCLVLLFSFLCMCFVFCVNTQIQTNKFAKNKK